MCARVLHDPNGQGPPITRRNCLLRHACVCVSVCVFVCVVEEDGAGLGCRSELMAVKHLDGTVVLEAREANELSELKS